MIRGLKPRLGAGASLRMRSRAEPALQGGDTRSGIALLAVLWALTAVTVLTAAALAAARIGSATTRNRLLLARTAGAREACAEILQARYAQDPSVRDLDSVDLGRGTWCSATLEDPSVKLNINLADRPALVTVLQAAMHRSAAVDSLVDALLDWRDPDAVPRPLGDESSANRNGPFADVWELRDVRGFTDSLVAQIAPFLTTRGTGAINVNAAPGEVLAAIPGITEESVRVLLMHRGSAPLPGADALVGLLSPNARATLLASYPEFVRAVVFAPPQLVGVVTGGVRGSPLVARATLTVVPVAGRLAVIRRETE
jgi:general secretion pathway protein K